MHCLWSITQTHRPWGMSLLAGTPGSCSVLWAPLSSRHLHTATQAPTHRSTACLPAHHQPGSSFLTLRGRKINILIIYFAIGSSPSDQDIQHSTPKNPKHCFALKYFACSNNTVTAVADLTPPVSHFIFASPPSPSCFSHLCVEQRKRRLNTGC